MIEKGHKHDAGVDIWSVGVLAYELLSGCSPFSPLDLNGKDRDQIEEETKRNILESKFVFPKDFSVMAKDFISKVLVKNQAQRIKIIEMKEHAWITTILERKAPGNKGKADAGIKKEIDKVNISPEEIGDKNASETFSNDEIYEYTRPDSIINKEHDDDFKKLPNYNKNLEIKMGGWESPDSDSRSQMVAKLSQEIKDLKARNAELEVLVAKKASDKDSHNDERLKKLEDDNLFYVNKVKLLEENLAKSKAEFNSTWKTLIEKEKHTKDLQNELLQKEEALIKSEKQRKKYKEELSVLEQKVSVLQAENEELKSKDGGEKKGELLDQFDDYLEKLKQKHKQELSDLTKKVKNSLFFIIS